jgi:hypothetical protein
VLPFFFGGSAMASPLPARPTDRADLRLRPGRRRDRGTRHRGPALLALARGALRLVAPGPCRRGARLLWPGVRLRWPRGRALLVALWLPPGLTALQPACLAVQGLSMALQVPDARIVEERSSPLGLLTWSKARPSLPPRARAIAQQPDEPPPQLGLFTDADSLTAITASQATGAACLSGLHHRRRSVPPH